jgi:lipase chaperone LimK
LFQDSQDLADNLEKARKYLYSVLPPQQAGEMLDLYKKYLTIQIDLQSKIGKLVKAETPETPETPEEALGTLSRLQEHRRAVFGKEIADIIFGPSEKAEEYSLRRQMILGDNNMYGLEKERRLHILNEAMWGSETMPFDENLTPYARYQEKLMLYQKDLSKERPEAERAATLEQFRREIFTPEQLQRMEEADRSLAEEKKNEEQYFAQEKEIMNDPSLDQEGKESKIRDLQDKTFGEEADAFRRGQIMQKAEEQGVKARMLELEQAKSGPFDEEALREQARKILEQQNASEQSKNETVN